MGSQPQTINLNESLIHENKILKEKIKLLEKTNNMNYEEYYSFRNGNVDKFFPKKLAKYLIGKHKLIYFAGENPYSYKNGVYKESKKVLSSISQYVYDEDPHSVKHTNDTKKEIIFNALINEKKLNPKSLISFKNCMLNYDTHKTFDHSSKIYNTYQIKSNYLENQSIHDTMFLKFLQDSGCSDNLINLIRQVIGYCLTSHNEAQKMFILKGAPRTGKSTFLNIIRSFFERQFTSTTNLEDLQKGEYLAGLSGKSINICGDIGQSYIKESSKLLQLVGEETITVRPLYVNPFDMTITAKQIYATNMIPNVNDKTGAFLRRCLIIPWNKVIKEEDTDVNIAEKIKTESDIITSWAIDSVKELKKNNFQFPKVKETIIETENYKLENNSLEMFVSKYCKIDRNNKDYYITISEFKNYYNMFCEVENIQNLGYKHLKDFTKNTLRIKEDKQTKLCKDRHYKGIAWTKEIRQLKTEKQKDLNFNFNSLIDSFIDDYEEIEREGIEND